MTLAKIGFLMGRQEVSCMRGRGCGHSGAEREAIRKKRQKEKRRWGKTCGNRRHKINIFIPRTERNPEIGTQLYEVPLHVLLQKFTIAAGGTAETRAGRGAGISFELPPTPAPASQHELAVLWKLHECAARQ